MCPNDITEVMKKAVGRNAGLRKLWQKPKFSSISSYVFGAQ